MMTAREKNGSGTGVPEVDFVNEYGSDALKSLAGWFNPLLMYVGEVVETDGIKPSKDEVHAHLREMADEAWEKLPPEEREETFSKIAAMFATCVFHDSRQEIKKNKAHRKAVESLVDILQDALKGDGPIGVDIKHL